MVVNDEFNAPRSVEVGVDQVLRSTRVSHRRRWDAVSRPTLNAPSGHGSGAFQSGAHCFRSSETTLLEPCFTRHSHSFG